MRALPSLTGLEAFDAVARRLSFSRAGRDLHITQSAVSHRVRALESELGVRLFTRSSRRVEPTPQGQALHRATADAFARLRDGLDEVTAMGHEARLTVSCSPSYAIRWLVPHLGSLRAFASDLEIHIAARDELVEPGSGAIDVCIRFGPGGYGDVQAERLLEECLTPVCSPRYAEQVGLREPSDLLRCELLHDDVLVDHPAHTGWTEWLRHAGVPDPDPERGLHFSHAHLALDAAAAGQGVALGRRALTSADRACGRLITPCEIDLASRLTYWFLTPRAPRRSDATERFHRWLVDTMASDIPG